MEFTTLMTGPWGKFDKQSKEIKKEILETYFKEWKQWEKDRRESDKWLVGIIPTFHN